MVDWLDENGEVRASDHYNKYGFLFARTIFNKKSEKVSKSYFDKNNREIILENFVTKDIILNEADKTLIFKGRTEFVKYFLIKNGLDKNRIFFNSLSVPFFVSNALQLEQDKNDILFWQENIKDEIPGNMQMIFKNQATRCHRIMVQNNLSMNKLKQLKAPANVYERLGFIYSFERNNMHRRTALICTNTENVQCLKELIEALPDVKFYVAALTEMSAKLLYHEKYDNAFLYPNVKASLLDNLFLDCDLYLDINHEGEIVNAVRRAFMQNQLIFAFNETAHNLNYEALENRFAIKDYKKMIQRIKALLNEREAFDAALESQRKHALNADKQDYQSRFF